MEFIWHPDVYARLRNSDSRLAEVYRLKTNAGCTEAEIAIALDITPRSVRRDLAKLQLLIQGFDPPPEDGMAEIVPSPLPPRPPLSTRSE